MPIFFSFFSIFFILAIDFLYLKGLSELTIQDSSIFVSLKSFASLIFLVKGNGQDLIQSGLEQRITVKDFLFKFKKLFISKWNIFFIVILSTSLLYRTTSLVSLSELTLLCCLTIFQYYLIYFILYRIRCLAEQRVFNKITGYLIFSLPVIIYGLDIVQLQNFNFINPFGSWIGIVLLIEQIPIKLQVLAAITTFVVTILFVNITNPLLFISLLTKLKQK